MTLTKNNTQKCFNLITMLLFSVVCLFLSNAHAGLYSRMNGQAVYDSDLNISWIADANLPATSKFTVLGIDDKGQMHWDTALSWIAAMNASNYLGFNDWRLPTALNPDQSGPCNGDNCKNSELGHLYYVEGQLTAGNLMLADPPGILGKYFFNIGALNGSASYWTGDSWSQNGNFAWLFSAYNGSQFVDSKVYNYNVWALRSGDVESQVPEPSVLGLAGIGALAWILATHKKIRV